MADLSFDVVIIGGGCKALPTGIYLAKYGGMSVGIFEATHELGGGLAGEQPAPGFQGNSHSWAQMDWYWNIVIKDDLPELWEEGFQSVGRMANLVNLFPDDTCLSLYGFDLDPDGSRSAAQIARFSEKDADAWLNFRKIYLEHIQPAFYEEMYSVPPPPGEPGPVMKAIMSNPDIPKAGLDPHIAVMTPLQGLKIIYESEELITALLRITQTAGLYCDDGGMALPTILNNYETFTHAMVQGGTHNLAHAMHRALYKYGAKTFANQEVDNVIIENGTAKGIRLKDGSQVEAKKAVISTLSPRQLCHDLIGADYLSPQILKKIDALETDRVCITWYCWALTEFPKWKAHDFNPDIDSDETYSSGLTFYTLGDKSIRSIVEEVAYRKMYKLPPNPLMVFMTAPPIAQLTADPNHCVALTEAYVPPAWAYPEEWWFKFQHEHAEWKVSKFQEYMVDMSWDKVAGFIPVTPYYTAKHFKNMAPSGNWQIIDFIPSQMGSYRPIPELAQHRTPVKNLYATGSGFCNWGASSLCAAYTCYKVMADDYGLRKPWEEQGRAY
jgi:phytoene dehydrogenase-like protein